jgi:hypothetical protein
LLALAGFSEALMKPGAKLVRLEFTVRPPSACDHHAGRCHTREPGETDPFPGHPHWGVGYAPMGETPLSLEEEVATASTGDIWLFRGRKLADLTIRALTNSPVNHVGMVVALDGCPPLLWHAELGRSLRDEWTGTTHRGVQLHRLLDAVNTWKERYGQRAWVRHLEGTIELDQEDELMFTIDHYDGMAFPTSLGLARRWLKGRVRQTSSLETIYCAELVAATYQRMGLLPEKRPASWYDPGRFWSGDRIALEPPFELGPELAVAG